MGLVREGATSILVVDDDADIRHLLRELLRLEGYACEGVGDGVRALIRIQAGGIALVLLDYRLPGLSGLEVCRNVRAAEATQALPIIIVSASLSHADGEACLQAGADALLAKPFEVDPLLDLVGAFFPR